MRIRLKIQLNVERAAKPTPATEQHDVTSQDTERAPVGFTLDAPEEER